jgi:hypothetical protein
MLKSPVAVLYNANAVKFGSVVVDPRLTMPGLTALAIVASGQARSRIE